MPLNSGVRSRMEDSSSNPTYHVKFDVTFDHPITAFALQMGGRFPLAFPSAPIILVDRNIVGMAKQIAASSKRHDVAANSWWFEFLNKPFYKLNPILHAMEGCIQQVPTLRQFIEEFHEASHNLAVAFPDAGQVTISQENFPSAYTLVTDMASSYASEQQFLLEVVPILASKVATNSLSKFEARILKAASKMVSGSSKLVVLAALSCLYESAGGSVPSIGRGLIKPATRFGQAQAHNAISDLRALEFLIRVSKLNGPAAAFATRDKYLTAFWCEIQASDVGGNGSKLKFNVKLTENLFPRLSHEKREELMGRLSAADF